MCEKGTGARVVISVIIACFLFSTTAQGQIFRQRTPESGGMGYSIFGGSTLDIDALNSRLERSGYSAISDNFFSTGGGGHWIFNNGVVIGGEVQTLLGDEAISGNYNHSVTAGYGIFNVGYNVYRMNQLRLYPLLGLGGGVLNFKISETPASLSFDEVLENPERSVQLSTGGFLLSFAVGMDYLLPLGKDETGIGGFVFGIRAGYTLYPFKSGWVLDDIDISGAPDMGITGPFMRLTFGGGGLEIME